MKWAAFEIEFALNAVAPQICPLPCMLDAMNWTRHEASRGTDITTSCLPVVLLSLPLATGSAHRFGIR